MLATAEAQSGQGAADGRGRGATSVQVAETQVEVPAPGGAGSGVDGCSSTAGRPGRCNASIEARVGAAGRRQTCRRP